MIKLIVLFFLSTFSFSQIKNGSIVYNLLPIENGSNLEKMYMALGPGLIDRAKEFDFSLVFDLDKAYFDINKKYVNDISNDTKAAKMKIEFSGAILQTKDSVYSNVGLGFLGSNLILKTEIEKNWILHNETKK